MRGDTAGLWQGPAIDHPESSLQLKVRSVGDIYQSADTIEGEARYDVLAEKLAALEE